MKVKQDQEEETDRGKKCNRRRMERRKRWNEEVRGKRDVCKNGEGKEEEVIQKMNREERKETINRRI